MKLQRLAFCPIGLGSCFSPIFLYHIPLLFGMGMFVLCNCVLEDRGSQLKERLESQNNVSTVTDSEGFQSWIELNAFCVVL